MKHGVYSEVPDDVMNQIRSVVTGRNGYRLEHVENESGATVDVGGTGSYLCPVSITGTQQQVDNARLLLRMW